MMRRPIPAHLLSLEADLPWLRSILAFALFVRCTPEVGEVVPMARIADSYKIADEFLSRLTDDVFEREKVLARVPADATTAELLELTDPKPKPRSAKRRRKR